MSFASMKSLSIISVINISLLCGWILITRHNPVQTHEESGRMIYSIQNGPSFQISKGQFAIFGLKTEAEVLNAEKVMQLYMGSCQMSLKSPNGHSEDRDRKYYYCGKRIYFTMKIHDAERDLMILALQVFE